MEAARLLGEGLSQSEVARELGVHRQSVSRCARELEQSGVSDSSACIPGPLQFLKATAQE